MNTKSTLNIVPVSECGDGCQGRLDGITVAQINDTLGFAPNCEDDPYKVKHSWGFTVNGVRCGVWDYKGSEKYNSFSTFGPDETLRAVFGKYYNK